MVDKQNSAEKKVLIAIEEPRYDPSETFLSRDLLKRMIEEEKIEPKKS